MSQTLAPRDLKREAAYFAVNLIEPGMVVGLGVGSTAIHAVRRVAELLESGRLSRIVCIPCSKATQEEAEKLGIPLTTLEEYPIVDLTIDGADEVDAQMNLIKGAGGALLREKVVAQASKREVIIVDASKLSNHLGEHRALPVEVTTFGHGSTSRFLSSIGSEPLRRMTASGEPFLTDQGNYIYDCNFGVMQHPQEIAAQLDSRAGIVEHGLFLDLATDLVVASEDQIRHITRD